MAHQATQAYYLKYASSKRDLRDWRVVYKIQPSSSLSNLDENDPSTTDDFFQEDHQLGSFSVDIGNFVDEFSLSRNQSDDVLDPDEIDIIEKQTNDEMEEESPENELEEYSDDDDEEEEEEGEEKTDGTEDEDDTTEHDPEYDDDDY
jgi:hypothetical protein